jgi:hypothetical protein
MLRPTTRRIIRDALFTGVALLIVHSYFAVSVFPGVHADRGIAKVELAWLIFDEVDAPAVPLAFKWLGPTSLMQAVFDRGYDLVGSGPNLRAFVLVSLAGGLQWFIIGCVLGAFLSAIASVTKSCISGVFSRHRPQHTDSRSIPH